ncbi:MAG TPA: VOC family protein [Pseudonocardia sp.]|jgi:catechol 2,3-dioxygenase-like lactoylglutathione lyase family enzyme
MITDARFAVVEIVVADMPAALAFYRALGLDVPAAADGEAHVDVALPGGLRLAFDTEATIASFHPARELGSTSRVSLAFALPDAAAVDRAYSELVSAGHRGELAPFDAVWGMRYAVVHDPDGTGVDLFAPLAS